MTLQDRIEIITEQLNQIHESINDGWSSPLASYISYKKISEALKTQMDELKSDAMVEMSRHGAGERVMHGVVVSLANVGGRWDFKSLDDWNDAKSKITEIENKYKSAFKTSQTGMIGVDTTSGEIVPLPKYSGPSETIKIKIPKKY